MICDFGITYKDDHCVPNSNVVVFISVSFVVFPYRVVTMDFYGRNDVTLGGFLERYCFRESYCCPSRSCDTLMVNHIRRFIHHTGSIQVLLKKLDAPMPSGQNNILMWEWCRKCKQVRIQRQYYSSPSILQPSVLRPPLIIRLLDLVPYFTTLCFKTTLDYKTA